MPGAFLTSTNIDSAQLFVFSTRVLPRRSSLMRISVEHLLVQHKAQERAGIIKLYHYLGRGLELEACVGELDIKVRLPRRRSEGVAKRQKIRLGAIAMVSLCGPPHPACKCLYRGCEAHAGVKTLCGLGICYQMTQRKHTVLYIVPLITMHISY